MAVQLSLHGSSEHQQDSQAAAQPGVEHSSSESSQQALQSAAERGLRQHPGAVGAVSAAGVQAQPLQESAAVEHLLSAGPEQPQQPAPNTALAASESGQQKRAVPSTPQPAAAAAGQLVAASAPSPAAQERAETALTEPTINMSQPDAAPQQALPASTLQSRASTAPIAASTRQAENPALQPQAAQEAGTREPSRPEALASAVFGAFRSFRGRPAALPAAAGRSQPETAVPAVPGTAVWQRAVTSY